MNKFRPFNLLFFTAILFFNIPCNILAQMSFKKPPKVDVHITLNKDTVASQDSIRVRIEIINSGAKVQQLLFDKPLTGFGGP